MHGLINIKLILTCADSERFAYLGVPFEKSFGKCLVSLPDITTCGIRQSYILALKAVFTVLLILASRWLGFEIEVR